MKLNQSKVLFVDCQTTAMSPKSGQLLEWAWCLAAAVDDEVTINSHLIRLDEGIELPPKVTEITGIRTEDLSVAPGLAAVTADFERTVQGAESPLFVVIHYAQFEKPFLLEVYTRILGRGELPFTVLCSHRLVKRLFPNLPSPNIRGASGFFGAANTDLKRAAQHVEATRTIWRGLCAEFERQGILDLPALNAWSNEKPALKVTRYEYRLDKLKRMQLPNTPGVYRMLAKSGQILYVGKATSLKSRVNSYFRGQKGRDRRKLEMLAQVWDLRVTPCATPLEAALLESDEIKHFNPRYNLVLKRGNRHLAFYNRTFTSVSRAQTREHPLGPFRPSNWIEPLRLLANSIGTDQFVAEIFYKPIPSENLRLGFHRLCLSLGIPANGLATPRSLLALGTWRLRVHLRKQGEREGEEETATPKVEEDRELTIEEIAAKFERLLRRAAAEWQRARRLTRLLDSDVTLNLESGPRALYFRSGKLTELSEREIAAHELPWSQLSVDDFDRMSILESELGKYDYEIQNRF